MPTSIALHGVQSAADRQAFAAVWNEVVPCNPYSADEFARQWKAAPASFALAGICGGVVVGAAHAQTQHWAPDASTAIAGVAVRSHNRGAGLGTVLADAAGEWARTHGCDGLDVFVIDLPHGGAGFWRRRGFAEIFRESIRELRLADADASTRSAPDGLAFVCQSDRPDLDDGVYAVASEAIADSPGGAGDRYAAGDREHWLANEYRAEGVISECTVVALDGNGTPVGYASLVRMEALPGTAVHGFTGVARAWRGRGVATALKVEQINRARTFGLSALRTENVAHNAPIVAINDRLGYREIYEVSAMRGPLTRTA